MNEAYVLEISEKGFISRDLKNAPILPSKTHECTSQWLSLYFNWLVMRQNIINRRKS